jgi:hypothetical protein
MNAELDHHLGYDKHGKRPPGTDNTRNGGSTKKLKGDFGEAEILVPRDRNASFEPKIVYFDAIVVKVHDNKRADGAHQPRREGYFHCLRRRLDRLSRGYYWRFRQNQGSAVHRALGAQQPKIRGLERQKRAGS